MEAQWKMDAEKLRNLLKDKQQRDAETLRGLIETANVSDAAKLLLGIAAETIEHGARLTEERRAHFLQEETAAAKDWSDSWKVTTLLAPLSARDTLADAGFYPMLHDGVMPQRPLYFLATDYDTFRTLVYEKTYEGRRGAEKVPYRLRFVPLFVEAERRLIETAELYHVTRPVIFSPWARRAVMIEAEGSENEEPLLCLKENSLANILYKDQMLYWNFDWRMREGADESVSSGKSPAFDEVHGIRKYYTKEDRWIGEQPEQLDFLLPEHLTGLRSVEKQDTQITVTGTNEWYTSSLERCELFRWHRPVEVDATTFSNAFSKGRVAASRTLCTRAQLDYLLQQLTQSPFSVVQADTEENASVLHRYERGMAYWRDRTQELFHLRARSGQTIRLAFTCEDEAKEMFLTDYANFVLDALERRAPYITWIAQRCEGELV